MANWEKTSAQSAPAGSYDSGLNFLAAALKWAFGFLLTLIVLLLIYFLSWGAYFSVEPQQAVIILRFGKVTECLTSGGHWFFPYPVNRRVTIQTNQQFMTVTEESAPTLDGAPPKSLTPGRDHYLLTGDANIIHTSWNIAYRVSDPVKFYTRLATAADPVVNGVSVADPEVVDADGIIGTRGPQCWLRNTFKAALLAVTSSSNIDALLAQGQGAYSEKVEQKFAKLVSDADCGLEILSVTLNRVSPPLRTKNAFSQVTAADNTRDTLRNQARAYAVEVASNTLAQKAEILAAAETYRRQIVAEIRSDSAYFESILSEYRQNPETIALALFHATLGDALGELKGDHFVLGTTPEQKQLRLKLNPEPAKPAENSDKEQK